VPPLGVVVVGVGVVVVGVGVVVVGVGVVVVGVGVVVVGVGVEDGGAGWYLRETLSVPASRLKFPARSVADIRTLYEPAGFSAGIANESDPYPKPALVANTTLAPS
jgi:hypothetical protein